MSNSPYDRRRTAVDVVAFDRFNAANKRAADAHYRETHCHRCGTDVPVSGWHTPKRACERCRNAKESSK